MLVVTAFVIFIIVLIVLLVRARTPFTVELFQRTLATFSIFTSLSASIVVSIEGIRAAL
jgi:hypothetical protein